MGRIDRSTDMRESKDNTAEGCGEEVRDAKSPGCSESKTSLPETSPNTEDESKVIRKLLWPSRNGMLPQTNEYRKGCRSALNNWVSERKGRLSRGLNKGS